MIGVKTHQPRGGSQKVGKPLGGHFAHVVGGHFVVPHAYAGRLFHLVELDMQRQHAGRAQDHVVVFQLRLDQRHARQFALGQKFTAFVHHHPGAIKLQPCFRQDGLLHRHAGAGFDRVDEQLRNHAAQVGGHRGKQRCVGFGKIGH